MNIVINGASARTGGGITYLRELLPPLAKELDEEAGASTHLLTSREVAQGLHDALDSSAITLHTPRWASLPGLERLPSEQTLLPQLLRRLSADVVFHTGDTIPLVRGAPNVLLCRNMLLYAPLGKHTGRLRALRLLARVSIRRATAVAFVSQALADQVTARVALRRWRVIHHGPGLSMSLDRSASRPNVPNIVLVGSIYDYKRIDLAIDAVAALWRGGRPATLDILGRPVETDYAEKLRQRVAELGIEHAVRFLGEASPSQVLEAYERATVAYVTSANESFCHPILEAFAAGIPVVLPTDLAVGPEIAGEAAVYCEPKAESFAQATISLCGNGDRYDRLVFAGKQQVQRFSWSATARETSGLILSCLGSRSSRSC